MSYIIRNNKLIAEANIFLKSGKKVRYAYNVIGDDIYLPKAFDQYAYPGVISNNKKWAKIADAGATRFYAFLFDDSGDKFLVDSVINVSRV